MAAFRQLSTFHICARSNRAASPLPRILVVRAAAADRDRAGVHVTVVDVPTLLGGIGRAAAGKFGHAHQSAAQTGEQQHRGTADRVCVKVASVSQTSQQRIRRCNLSAGQQRLRLPAYRSWEGLERWNEMDQAESHSPPLTDRK
jgi:hypothetical protein